MNEYDRRIIYILWWECGVSNNWYVVGTYTSKNKVIAAVEHYMQHDDGSGTLFINRVNLSQEKYALT